MNRTQPTYGLLDIHGGGKIGASWFEKEPAASCVVQSVACFGDLSSVNEVTHIGFVIRFEQGRVVHMRVNTDGMRMVLLVPGRVHGGAVRKVSNVVDKLRQWQS